MIGTAVPAWIWTTTTVAAAVLTLALVLVLSAHVMLAAVGGGNAEIDTGLEGVGEAKSESELRNRLLRAAVWLFIAFVLVIVVRFRIILLERPSR